MYMNKRFLSEFVKIVRQYQIVVRATIGIFIYKSSTCKISKIYFSTILNILSSTDMHAQTQNEAIIECVMYNLFITKSKHFEHIAVEIEFFVCDFSQ